MNHRSNSSVLGRSRKIEPALWMATVLSNSLSQIGWLFFGIGMLFVWIFSSQADLSVFTMNAPLAVTQGVVTGHSKTKYSIGRKKHKSRTPVYKTSYEFFTPPGQRWEGESYATGTYENPGQSVTIEYNPSRPEQSRIQGMRTRPLGIWALFVVIFPLIGMVLIWRGWFRGLRHVDILQKGIASSGMILSEGKAMLDRPGNRARVRQRKRTHYRYTIGYKDQLGKEWTQKLSLNKRLLTMDGPLQVLYDPQNAGEAIVLKFLPGQPELKADGNLQIAKPFVGYFGLILAMLALDANLLYLVLSFF